eukprot:UN26886
MCCEIEYNLHYLFVIYLIIVVIDAAFLESGSAGYLFLYNFWCLLVLVLEVFWYSLGRIAMAKSLGGTTDEIVLWPFGAFSRGENVETIRSYIWVNLGGTIALTPMFILWYVMWNASKSDDCEYKFLGADEDWKSCLWSNVSNFGFSCSAFLVGVNLIIPAYPLSGSHLIVYIMSFCSEDLKCQAKACLIMIGAYFVGFAVLAIIYHHWLSVIMALFLLYAGIGLNRSSNLEKHAMFRSLLKLKSEEKHVELRTKRRDKGLVKDEADTGNAWNQIDQNVGVDEVDDCDSPAENQKIFDGRKDEENDVNPYASSGKGAYGGPSK